MESYIHLYKTNDKFTEAYNGPDYVEPWLSLTEENMEVNYNKPKLIDFSAEPLTFNILSAGTINWTASNTAITKTIDYKLNDGEWASVTSNTGSSAPTINVVEGDKIQFRGNNTQYAGSSSYNSFSGSTALFEAEGNIMSLIYGDNFKNKLTISSEYAFYSLFSDCAKLVSAENLVLPATTLVNRCYWSMFFNCTSLTTAPELPATTLANYCYSGMFSNCTSLTTAPELPATTLATYCYGGMFFGCSRLNYIKCLATDIPASDCTYSWVRDVASTGTFVKNPDMASWRTGTSGIPTGWTVQDA